MQCDYLSFKLKKQKKKKLFTTAEWMSFQNLNLIMSDFNSESSICINVKF